MNNKNLLQEDNEVPDYLDLTLQKLQPYKLENGNHFHPWLDFFEYVTDMIGVPDDKLIEIFNSMIDDEIHRNVNIFVSYISLSKLSYDLLTDHYLYYFYRMEPPKIHMNRFQNRNQYETEPIERYASNLEKIFEKCNPRNESDKMLIKRFIEGFNDNKFKTYIKRHFVASFNETVKKVISISRALNKYTCECHTTPLIHIYRHGNADIFCLWFNNFEFLEDFHGTPDDRRLINFNFLIDTDFKTLIKNHYNDINFSELSYEDTVNLYLRYYMHPDERNLHRKRFYYRVQYEIESIEGYAERLRKIYNKCNFNDSLEEILSDQFVNGLCKNKIKKHFKRSNNILFVVVVSFAIKCEKFAATINYEIPDLSKIHFYNPENEGTFWDWLNEFQYKVKILKLDDLAVPKMFNKKIHNDVHENVKKANPDIDFSEILYEDTIALYLRYFASADETDVYRKLFLCRNQYEQEKIAEYADNLCDIFQNCNCTGNREQILIDKFINGIYDNEMKKIFDKFSRLNFRQFIKLVPFFEQFQKLSSYFNSALRKIQSFHPENGEEFSVWLNKFEYIADIIEIPNDEIVEFFEYMVDDDVHELVKDANSDLNLSHLRSDELIDCYLRFYASPNETDLHLKRFLCRNQYEQENLSKYFSMLYTLHSKCNIFNLPEERLGERFREGLFDDKLRIYLSNFQGLTPVVTLAKAIVFEYENTQS